MDSPDRNYCDFEHPVDVSYRLYLLGQAIFIVKNQTLLLYSLQDDAFVNFFLGNDTLWVYDQFDATMDTHDTYREAGSRNLLMEDRYGVLKSMNRLEGYRVNHHWLFLVAPIWFEYMKPPRPSLVSDKIYSKAAASLYICTHTTSMHIYFPVHRHLLSYAWP